MSKKLIDQKHPDIVKARQIVSDKTLELLDAVTDLEGSVADSIYQQGFDDGIAWAKEQFRSAVKTAAEVEPELTKPAEISDLEKLLQQGIIGCVNANPGLRTSDITSKILTTFTSSKTQPTEGSIWININRLRNEGKIESKNGRWYSSDMRRPDQQYKVMTYLPDGSKYLAADIIKN